MKNNTNERHKKERIGLKTITTEGYEVQIIKYNSYIDIDIRFNDTNRCILKGRNYSSFKDGKIKNPYHRSIMGVGFIGQGKHRVSINSRLTNKYNMWYRMFERCYGKKYQKKNPTYTGCRVCDEWHNFQNFGDWYDENFYNLDGFTMTLDKDIIKKGNKLYSPKRCIVAPSFINVIFVNNKGLRGRLPIGVTQRKRTGKFEAQCNCTTTGKKKYLGEYESIDGAFHAYKIYKESQIKEVADHYKDKIPKKLYDAMYKWEIEITD